MSSAVSFSCHKCSVKCASLEEYKEHLASNVHHFNTLRSVDGQGFLTEKQFNQITESIYSKQDVVEPAWYHCVTCNKFFSTEGPYQSHLNSKTHKTNVAREAAQNLAHTGSDEGNNDGSVSSVVHAQYCKACKKGFSKQKDFKRHCKTPSHLEAEMSAQVYDNLNSISGMMTRTQTDSMERTRNQSAELEQAENNATVISDDEEGNWEDLPDEPSDSLLLRCLFCVTQHDSSDDVFSHMAASHGFIIPYEEVCTNKPALLQRLLCHVLDHKCCVQCYKCFADVRSCILHMLQKPHLTLCLLELELPKYFDLHKLEQSAPVIELPRTDETVSEDMLVTSLQLPGSNTIIVPRQLARYAKQNLPPADKPTVTSSKQERLRRLALTGGNTSSSQLAEANGPNMAVVTRNSRMAEGRRNIRTRLDVSVKANKMQHHFRSQVLGSG